MSLIQLWNIAGKVRLNSTSILWNKEIQIYGHFVFQDITIAEVP